MSAAIVNPHFKYLFKGHAVALQGSIQKPYYQDLGNHLEIFSYAGSGGETSAENVRFKIGEHISYESAKTEIIASEMDGLYECTVTAQVLGLRVGERLEVDEVTCKLRSVYEKGDYPRRMTARISPAGSTIRNLRIDGKTRELRMPPAFEPHSKHDDFLRGKCSPQEEADYTPGYFPEPIYVADFGTIYYAEWAWVHPGEKHRQNLTMLRLALGSAFGADARVSSGSNDGSGWPPLAS